MKKFSLLFTMTAFTLIQQVSAESIAAVTDLVQQSTVTDVEEFHNLGKGIPAVSLLGIFNSTAIASTTVQLTIWDPTPQDGSELGSSKTFQVCKTNGGLPVIESATLNKTSRRGESVLEIKFRYTEPSLGETPDTDVDVSIVSSLKVTIKSGISSLFKVPSLIFDIIKLINSGRIGSSDVTDEVLGYKIPFVILAAQTHYLLYVLANFHY